MLRRKFIGVMTLLGAGGLASLATVESTRGAMQQRPTSDPKRAATVRYAVEGFTCITCAVGLETLLRKEEGVLSASANYPKANVEVEFDPHVITEISLKTFIQSTGFRVSNIPL